jgi:hypothetical protein
MLLGELGEGHTRILCVCNKSVNVELFKIKRFLTFSLVSHSHCFARAAGEGKEAFAFKVHASLLFNFCFHVCCLFFEKDLSLHLG